MSLKVPMHPDYYFYAGKIGTAADKAAFRAERLVGKYLAQGSEIIPQSELDRLDELDLLALQDVLSQTRPGVMIRIFEKFRSNPKSIIYRVNKDFARAMSRMDVELRKELLPSPGFSAYFVFEPGAIPFNPRVLGGYAMFDKGPGQYLSFTGVGIRGRPREGGVLTFADFNYMRANIVAGEMWENTTDRVVADGVQEEIFDQAKELNRLLLNLSMYVHSLNPDVSELKPERTLSKSERSAAEKTNLHLRSSVYPVTLLNWNFGKDREYSVDSTIRRAHLRWQACGPGRSQTKLVMVEEHEVHYKNVKKEGLEIPKQNE